MKTTGKVWKFGRRYRHGFDHPGKISEHQRPEGTGEPLHGGYGPRIRRQGVAIGHHRGGQEFRLRIVSRTRPHRNQGGRGVLRDREKFRPYFL